MKTKISHSAVSKYQLCPTAYKYHYIDRIRSQYQSAALVFGSALDVALNELLLPTGGDPYEIFINNFKTTKINNEEISVPTYSKLVYSNSDFDFELLTETDHQELSTYLETVRENLATIYDGLKKKKTTVGFDKLSDKEKAQYNLFNWYSLKNKGKLMLDAYKQKILPQIEEVLAVQEWVKLVNQDGDEVTGVVDLVARVKDHGVVILDNKTSAMDYEEDSVLTSPQLSLYVHALSDKYKTRKAGYIVLKKNLQKNRIKICSKCGYNGGASRAKTCDNIVDEKRCHGSWNETISPEVNIQFIVDEIPTKTEQLVLENYDDINRSIKAGVFHRNLNSCANQYGGPCVYLNLCYKDKTDGLVDLKKESKNT